MSKYKMISPKVPNVPWQERPAEFQMQPAATILIVKSGISNHAASGILDFTPKNSPLPVTLERYGSLIFCLQLISCTLSRLLGAF